MSDTPAPLMVRDELVHIIEQAIAAHPRSLQARIGPSEMGTPCARKLGHKLAGTPERERSTPWRPTVGTAVHSWLDQVVTAFEAQRLTDGKPVRWHTEQRVNVGQVDGVDISGSCDLFEQVTGTVIDFKIVGPASLKKYKAGPNETYRVQAHLYGLGYVNAGHTVNHVAIWALPAAGELHQAVFWHEPFDPAVAHAALKRADAIAKAGRLAGWAAVLPQLDTANDFCSGCPFRSDAANPDPSTACPGHADRVMRQDTFNDLVA
jgi:hypothetical protein